MRLWLCAAALAFTASCSAPREYDFYIPAGYVGQVSLQFGVRDAGLRADEPKEGIVRVPVRSGQRFGYLLDGNSKQRFFYDSDPPRRLLESGPCGGGMIWNRHIVTVTTLTPTTPRNSLDVTTLQFFVGTESQYRGVDAVKRDCH